MPMTSWEKVCRRRAREIGKKVKAYMHLAIYPVYDSDSELYDRLVADCASEAFKWASRSLEERNKK